MRTGPDVPSVQLRPAELTPRDASERSARADVTGRAQTLLLLAVVGVSGLAYLQGGLPRHLILGTMAACGALAVVSPPAGIAVALATAANADGLIAWIVLGNPARHHDLPVDWAEPILIATCAGILVRRLFTGRRPAVAMPGVAFYCTVVACALILALAPYATDWRGATPRVLALMWRSLPVVDESVPDYMLHAGLLAMAGLLWFSLVRASLRTPAHVRIALIGFLIGALMSGVYGHVMWARGEGAIKPRIESVFDDTISYGSFLVLALFVAGAIVMSPVGRRTRALAAAVLPFTVSMLFFSASKVALLTALGGIAVLALVALRSRRRTAAVLAAAVLGVSGLAYALTPVLPYEVVNALKMMTAPSALAEGLVAERLAIWRASLRAAVSAPAFGIGPGLLYRHLGTFYTEADAGNRPRHDNAHDYYLQVAAETGVLGLLGFLGVLGSACRATLAGTLSLSRLALAIGILGYLVTMLTGHPLILSKQVVLFWGILGVAAANVEERRAEHRPRGTMRVASVAVPACVLLILVILGKGPLRCARTNAIVPAVVADYAIGYHAAERFGAAEGRWMRDAGELTLCPRQGPAVVDVTLTLASFHHPRTLDVFVGGRRTARLSVSETPMVFTLPRVSIPDSGAALVFIAAPGASRVDRILENGDQRLVSVFFSAPTISVLR